MRIEGPFLPPFEENCPDDYGGIAYFPPEEYVLLAAISGGSVGIDPPEYPPYESSEGRLVESLREIAQLQEPIPILTAAVKAFYFSINEADRHLAQTYTDFAATGRTSFTILRVLSAEDIPALVESSARGELIEEGETIDEPKLQDSIESMLNRLFSVVWILRGPTEHRIAHRHELGWIGVSGDDDPPHRPVNNENGTWPQFDIPLNIQGVSTTIRAMVASSNADYESPQIFNNRAFPNELELFIPNDEELIIFIHGHSSRAEEASDLIPHLHTKAEERGRRVTVLSFDLPSCGYSQMLDHQTIGDIETVSRSNDIFPILTFYEETVISLVDYIDNLSPVKDRIAAIIGGSLGGNLGLRFLERRPSPDWLEAVVSWSAASVWESLEGSFDLFKSLALSALEGNSLEAETFLSTRLRYFHDVFDGNQDLVGIEIVPVQPEMWYRDSWSCKELSILGARTFRQEIYNELFRTWHWRVAYEQLVFSHLNTIPSTGGMKYYRRIVKPLLLLAGEEDNFNFSHIHDASRDLARLMPDVEQSKGVFLKETGHSIHNERPEYLATEIFNFLGLIERSCGQPQRNATLNLGPIDVIDELDERSNSRPYLWCSVATISGNNIRQDRGNPNRLVGDFEFLSATGTEAHLGFGNSYPGATLEVPLAVGGPARSTHLIPIRVFEETGFTLYLPSVHISTFAFISPTAGHGTTISAHQLFNYLVRQRLETFIENISLYRIWSNAQTRSSSDEISLQKALEQVMADEFMILQNSLNDPSLSGSGLTAIVNGMPVFRDELVGVQAIVKTGAQLVNSSYQYDFSDAENLFSNGSRSYRLNGNIAITQLEIPVNCTPEDRRLRIEAVRTVTSSTPSEYEYISHYAGVSSSGRSWIFTKSHAITLILRGMKEFYVLQEDGDETQVILSVHPESRNYYLRTESNETEEDNLLSLPSIDFYSELFEP